MAAPKRPTHRVTQSGIYFNRGKDGKLQELEVGMQLTLTPSQGEQMEARGFVTSLKNVKSVDMTNEKSGDKDKKPAKTESVKDK